MKTKLLFTLIFFITYGFVQADIVIVVYGAGGIVVCGETTTICPQESTAQCQTITIKEINNCDGIRGYFYTGGVRINFSLEKPIDILIDQDGCKYTEGFSVLIEN
jgi:hypothetical protein